MPFSQSSQLSTIVGFIEKMQLASVLDVGIGFGQYGFLTRINLEHLNLFELTGSSARKRAKDEWKIRIDGIEGYPDYISPVHEYSYNDIFLGNALEILPDLESKYDLVMAIDILEHLEKNDGYRFIQLLKNVSSKCVLISTPKEFIEQHIDANPYENHRSHWSEDELKNSGLIMTLPNSENWVVHNLGVSE